MQNRNNQLLTNSLLVIGAIASFYVLFLLITLVLRMAPEPIGSRADLFVDGAKITLMLTLTSGALGLLFGMVIGLMRTSNNLILKAISGFYVWVLRGTPLLVQILFVYLAMPQIITGLGSLFNQQWDFTLNEFQSAMWALALNVGAYNAEVIRGGIQAIPRGQSEAARSLGLSGGQTMGFIVLPQALRIVVPPLVNNLIALLKDTSLASTIALVELSLAGSRVSSETFQPIPVLVTVACVYLLLTTVMTFFTDRLESMLKTKSR